MRVATRSAIAAILAIFSWVAPSAFAAQQVVRAPKDAKDLQAAINLVADGGTIEMSAGTYATPPRGFEISNLRKGFTVRAVGEVVLDGGGTNRLLRFENGKRDRGKLVTFEGITFRNGNSLTEGLAGGVTLSAAEARFVDCLFEDNHATGRSTGGGAARVVEDSDVTFSNTVFRGNTSLNRGGAIEVIDATVAIQGGELGDNRVTLPGHKATASGGAIYALSSTLRVTRASLYGNHAAWAGGAIWAFGQWTDPESTPRTLVQVSRSTFANNGVGGGEVPPPGPTTGGAIHVEDHTTLEIDSSVFWQNIAEHGGALDSYRAIVEIRGSYFQGNLTTKLGGVGAGGAIFASSVDFADASTAGGAINRRPTRLTISDSLLSAEGFGPAFAGGCLLAAGDESRAYGSNGVPAAGTLEENRARVELRRTVFSSCTVENAPQGGGGTGGAAQLALVDLLMEDCLVLGSHSSAFGGGMAIGRDSGGLITRSSFTFNVSKSGGALFLQGSAVQIADSSFISNIALDGRGGAIFAMPFTDPALPRNVGGLVSGSIFTGNSGAPIFDNDPASGPINEVRYNANQFHLSSGSSVYANNLAAPGGISAADLNSLVVNRGSRGSTDKSDGGNARIFGAPRLGSLLAVPPFLGAGAPGSLGHSFLAYAWSGGSATLGGKRVNNAGVDAVTAAGNHALIVDGGAIDMAQIAASACTSGPTLCLNGDRFVAEVSFKDFNGKAGTGKAASLTSDTGTFWFFDESNVEIVVKVLDGRAINGRFWVFYGALSSVEYTLKITDTVTGRVRTYQNPAGKMASAADTNAFPAGGASSSFAEPAQDTEVAQPPEQTAAATASCVPGPTDLCISGRFRVSLNWKAQGNQGAGQAVPLTTDTGYFWFFQATNVEVVIKVLDGRPLNGHFWVFYGALTDVEYQITVVDTQTGRQKVYKNPAGKMASVGDTSALPD